MADGGLTARMAETTMMTMIMIMIMSLMIMLINMVFVMMWVNGRAPHRPSLAWPWS